MSRNEEITGVFEWEERVFQPEDPEQRTVIGRLSDGTTIKGRAMAGALEYGLTYRFLGHWTQTKWGKQFHFSSFALAKPAGELATVLYLAKGPHLGRARGQRIWNLFGERSLEVVRTEPERIAAEIDGMTPERAQEAAEYFRRFERLERVTIEVNDLLANKGFPRTLPDKVIREWGEESPRKIREETWPLMRFRGVGFLRCDALYLELGRDPAAVERQAFCLWHSMASDSEGHTWFHASHCAKALTKSIRVGASDMAAAVRLATDQGMAAQRVDYRGGTWLAEAKKSGAEQRLAEYVRRAEIEAATTLPRWPAPGSLEAVSEHQADEYSRATSGFLGILAGSPGTGKTYTLARVVRAIQAGEGAARVAICAPTGKAAVRCTENLSKQGVPIVATTIHRLLGVQQVDDTDGWAFVHCEDMPLELDFLFVDEVSMCDATLLSQLLAARPNGCHVLLVGDPDQLSPVGHGAPLRDLIAAGVPKGHLKEIRRNAGRIVRACAEIRDKQRITFSPKLDLEAGENLLLLEREQPEDQVAELEQFLLRIAGGKKFDPVWDVQVVVPVNDKSPLARKKLNKSLQQLLNPKGEQLAGCLFRVGDKLVCLKNGSLPLIEGDANGSPTTGEAYVANGEQARVVALAESSITLKLETPARLIRVPRGKRQEPTDGEEGSENKTGCNFDLAYAISTHKGQGSEWSIVVVMIDGYGGAVRLCDRHWFYTAISRAKTFCLCIGKKSVVQSMVRKSHMWNRKTFLRERIEEARVSHVQREWELLLADEDAACLSGQQH